MKPSRSRRHKTVEPIDLRELLEAPALNGLAEVLLRRREPETERSSSPAPTVIPITQESVTERHAVGSPACEVTAPEPTALALDYAAQSIDNKVTPPEITAVNFDAHVKSNAVESTAFDLTQPDCDLDAAALGHRTGRRTFAVQSATRIEIIFSPSELKVLNWMWARGRAVAGTTSARLVTAANGEGMRRMAVHFGVAYTTFRNLVRSLSTKLAIEIVKQETTHPALYLIYHYSAILARIQAAGLTGVVHKGSNCWELVDAESRPAPGRPELTVLQLRQKLAAFKSTAVDSGIFISATNKANAVLSTAVLPESSAVISPAPIRNKEYPSLREFPTSSTANSSAINLKPVVDALFEKTNQTDADAARSIMRGCQAVNSSVTASEIARLIGAFNVPRSISNPVGLMIRALPPRCEASSIENYRRQWAEEERQTQIHLEETRRVARMVLDDPDTDEEGREWARGVLNAG